MSTARLPPLNSLKAFDAVVRHMSFTQAANELFVTPAALSYQIKQLEVFLDVKLFNRLSRSIELTPHGKLIYPGIGQAFEQLSQTMQLLQQKRSGDVLVISAGPAFTANWLAPRLYRFVAQYPHIDARVSASLTLSNLKIDDVDVAVRFGEGAYADCLSEKLFDDYIVPMCSPSFLAKRAALSVAGLLSETLIYDDTHIDQKFSMASWQDWFTSMGIKKFKPTVTGLHFNVADHALSAAVAGAGIVLGRQALAQNDLDAGRLVMPFEHKLKVDFSYYALCLETRAQESHIKAFLDWLRAEVAGDIDLTALVPVV
ncbi:MAG: transcriptional regulator GcvA [Oceanospirillaceae bacterium]